MRLTENAYNCYYIIGQLISVWSFPFILQSLTRETKLVSETGREVEALNIFSYGLAYFKDHALAEISEQTGMRVTSDIIKWVVTVPAIWKPAAKQFMRQAAYNVSKLC